MASIALYKSSNLLFLYDDDYHDDFNAYPYVRFECRTDFFPGINEQGQPRGPIPTGKYVATIDESYAGDEDAYGPYFINVDTERGRGIHGGGTDLQYPMLPRQGWEKTRGCGRMQNEDLEKVVQFIRDKCGGRAEMNVYD